MADVLGDNGSNDRMGDPPEGPEEIEPFGWMEIPHPHDPEKTARLYHKDGSIRNELGQMIEPHPAIGMHKPENVKKKMKERKRTREEKHKAKMREGWTKGVLKSTAFQMQNALDLMENSLKEEGDDTAFIVQHIMEQVLDPKTPLRDKVMAFEKIGELAGIHQGKKGGVGKIADTVILNVSRDVLLESFDDEEDIIDVTPIEAGDVPF